jgi:hypothetical protein
MKRFARVAATLAIIAPLALSHGQVVTQQAAPVAIPDSPAGKMLSAWLEAFNSVDSTKIAAYIRKNEPHKNVDNQVSFGLNSRGFDLVSIEKNQPRHLEYVLKDHSRGQLGYGTLDVNDNGGAASVLAAFPPGARAADFKIDAAARASAIEGAIAKLDESYVFPDVAKKMADAVRGRLKRGEYDDVTNGIAFAAKLTEHLQDVSHDKHLRVNFFAGSLPPAPAASSTPSPDEVARYRRQMESINCGFVKAEQLANNVGYLKFNMFADPDVCGPTASAATLPAPGLTARVAMIPLVLGDDGSLVDFARTRFDGLILEGFGRGNVPPGAVPAIRRWLDGGKPVVLASRCPFGEVGGEYAFEGGGGQLIRLGVVPAGKRPVPLARLELMLCLSAGVPYGGVGVD